MQSLLISMEISRHGCNPTSQLGNALVVSLFIWMGLSAIYRLLALLVAPGIEFKHCLCVTGYGFFAWNVALLCIFPLENLYDTLQVPTMLPLVIFGLPSSLAQVRDTHTCSAVLLLLYSYIICLSVFCLLGRDVLGAHPCVLAYPAAQPAAAVHAALRHHAQPLPAEDPVAAAQGAGLPACRR